MVSGTDAGRRHVDPTWIGLGVGNELGNRLDRHRGVHLYGKRLASDARDRRDVADEIEIELVVEGGVDRVHESSHKERISVRGRVHDRLGADIAGSSWSVLDDELLAEPLRQPLSYQACHDVGATGGGKSDDDAHRPRRIGLRPCDTRSRWQYGGA